MKRRGRSRNFLCALRMGGNCLCHYIQYYWLGQKSDSNFSIVGRRIFTGNFGRRYCICDTIIWFCGGRGQCRLRPKVPLWDRRYIFSKRSRSIYYQLYCHLDESPPRRSRIALADSPASTLVKLSECIFPWSLIACKMEIIFVSSTMPPMTISSST